MKNIFSKQDVFVGFATVPGFVSLTSDQGSPYLQVVSVSDVCTTTDEVFFSPRLWRPSCLIIMTPPTWPTSTSWSRGSSPG